MAVVLQHFSATAQPLTPHWIPSIVPHGYMAVHFFFYLSGFIMCMTYLDSFERKGLGAYSGFLLKRVARIAPLNVFALALLMLLGIASYGLLGRNVFFKDDDLAFDLMVNLLMLQGLGIGTNLNGPSWSISTEFAAYVLFPVFILAVFRAGWIVRVATLTVAVVALTYVSTKLPRLGLGSHDTADRLIETFAEFVLGMGSFILFRYRLNVGMTASDTEVGLLTALLGAGLIAGIDLPVSLICPFLVVAVALNKGGFARVLSGGVPYFLGLISFSIYLIHEPFRPLGVLAFQHFHPGPTTAPVALLFAFVGSVVVIPFAWLTYVAVERPGRDVLRGWAERVSGRHRTPRPAQAARIQEPGHP